jgi:hypothetical protein
MRRPLCQYGAGAGAPHVLADGQMVNAFVEEGYRRPR